MTYSDEKNKTGSAKKTNALKTGGNRTVRGKNAVGKTDGSRPFGNKAATGKNGGSKLFGNRAATGRTDGNRTVPGNSSLGKPAGEKTTEIIIAGKKMSVEKNIENKVNREKSGGNMTVVNKTAVNRPAEEKRDGGKEPVNESASGKTPGDGKAPEENSPEGNKKKSPKRPRKKSEKILLAVLWIMFAGFLTMFVVTFVKEKLADYKTDVMQEELSDIKNSYKATPTPMFNLPTPSPTPEPTKMPDATPTPTPTPTPVPPAEILPEYRELYERNNDMVGWLTIDGTVIDYPVMQTLDDEEYYLHKDFDKNDSVNGCLLLDTDTLAGTGTRAMNYEDGTAPTTNLIIHGHTMKSGKMFGKLSDFEKESYGKAHSIIKFDTLYEHREYELIAVFRSQVYKKSDKVFKYYKFFNAETEEEFEDWYTNIILKSVYDTRVTAEFGDEFITLSCCAYHVDNGRFVVVGRRIRPSEGEDQEQVSKEEKNYE